MTIALINNAVGNGPLPTPLRDEEAKVGGNEKMRLMEEETLLNLQALGENGGRGKGGIFFFFFSFFSLLLLLLREGRGILFTTFLSSPLSLRIFLLFFFLCFIFLFFSCLKLLSTVMLHFPPRASIPSIRSREYVATSRDSSSVKTYEWLGNRARKNENCVYVICTSRGRQYQFANKGASKSLPEITRII